MDVMKGGLGAQTKAPELAMLPKGPFAYQALVYQNLISTTPNMIFSV